EEGMSRRGLIRRSLIFGILGVILLILGFIFDSGGLRGFGNLAILTALLLWFYKYVLSPAKDYFQYNLLVKLEAFYERFLKFALSKRNAYYFLFGTFGVLVLSFVLIALIQPNVLFFPENEPNQIITYIEYPQGTDIAKTNELTKAVEERIFSVISKYEDKDGYNFMVESAISQVGQGAGNPMANGGMSNEMPEKGKITL